MKEADKAAYMSLPVLYNGREYRRITQTGYNYDERRGRIPFVQLLDKNKNSVTYADPALCEVKMFSQNQNIKEYEYEPNDERDTPSEL